MSNPQFQKDLKHFNRRADSLETKPELLTEFITPNEMFFVCTDASAPQVNIDDYTLKIDGDGVGKPLALSYEAIMKLPAHSVTA